MLYLGQQGLAIRGHEHSGGNYKELLLFLRNRDANFDKYFNERHLKNDYSGWSCQNEMLGLLGNQLIDSIVKNVKDAKFFSVIADETTDKGVTEQMSLCVRYVTLKPITIVEKWLTFKELIQTSAEVIVEAIKTVIGRYGLSMENCRGQAYDGALNMRGMRTGVKTRILQEYPKATFSYCSGHNLNLVVKDASCCHEWLFEA